MPARISRHATFHATSPEATAELAECLGSMLSPGDTILLSGPVGAGKTHFARHLIHALLEVPEHVPSPTFTLVQTYDTRAGPLWHVDLYRIGSVQEIEELGLLDAFDTAICLVEWPDRLGDLRPAQALALDLRDGATDEARIIAADWTDPRWDARLAGWQAA
jgi:tRNA threonylcarbamoyladenosine biosynthesis protein TsaE